MKDDCNLVRRKTRLCKQYTFMSNFSNNAVCWSFSLPFFSCGKVSICPYSSPSEGFLPLVVDKEVALFPLCTWSLVLLHLSDFSTASRVQSQFFFPFTSCHNFLSNAYSWIVHKFGVIVHTPEEECYIYTVSNNEERKVKRTMFECLLYIRHWARCLKSVFLLTP